MHHARCRICDFFWPLHVFCVLRLCLFCVRGITSEPTTRRKDIVWGSCWFSPFTFRQQWQNHLFAQINLHGLRDMMHHPHDGLMALSITTQLSELGILLQHFIFFCPKTLDVGYDVGVLPKRTHAASEIA